MKFGLMVFLTGLGVTGGLAYAPFVPAAMYHFFSVLRPQFIWGESLTPVVGKDFPWSLILAASAIGAALLARGTVWLAPRRFASTPLPRANVGHAAMAVFALAITLSHVNATIPAISAPVFSDYLKIFAMFFVTCLVMVTVRQVCGLYLLTVLALVYIAVEVNEIYFLNDRFNFLYRVGFCGLDNNGAALLLAMGVPMCVYAWDGIRHPVRWAFPVGLVLLVHAVMLSYSRGAMLALVATAPLYIFRCRDKKVILACYLGGALLTPFLAGNEIAARFASIGEASRDASAQSRFTTWRIAWKMAKDKPVTGYGIRNSSEFTYAMGADAEGRVIHSTYLQIAADSGLTGMAAYLAFLGAAFYCGFRVFGLTKRRLAANPDDEDARWAYTAACGAEGALAVWVVGGALLSLETFEPPYLVSLMLIQLWSIVRIPPPAQPVPALPEGQSAP